MSRFLDELELGLVADVWPRPIYQLLAQFRYESDILGFIVVPLGFHTDLASVPRIPVVFDICGDTSTMASVVHDYLYAHHPCTRAQADAVLREASIVSGVPKWKAWLMWAGVRVGGRSPWFNDINSRN